MDHDSDNNYLPRAPRFEVANKCETVVTITRTGGAEEESITAELVDISQYGTKLLVPVNLRFEESLQLKIEVVGTELAYHGIGSVRHIRSVESESLEESWLIGCAIAPPLTDETFSYLATTAGTERRRFRRLPIAAEVTVRRQAQADGCAATLHNLSSGGFCCSSTMHYEVGERIQLTIVDTDGEPQVIEARICWQVDSPDGSIVGCEFSSRSSYSALCACLSEYPMQERQAQPATEPTSKLVLTAAVLAMFLPPMMTLLLQAKKSSAESSRVPSNLETSVTLNEEVASAVARRIPTPEETKPCTDRLAENQPLATVGSGDTPKRGQALTPLAEPQHFRAWLDNTGKHRTEAKLISVNSEFVVLQKPNGREAKVPWRRLSDADQALARAWQSREE